MIKTSHPQNYFKEKKAKLIKLIQAEQIQVKLIQAKYGDQTNYVKARQPKSSLTGEALQDFKSTFKSNINSDDGKSQVKLSQHTPSS